MSHLNFYYNNSLVLFRLNYLFKFVCSIVSTIYDMLQSNEGVWQSHGLLYIILSGVSSTQQCTSHIQHTPVLRHIMYTTYLHMPYL